VASVYDAVDIYWNWNGDLSLDKGDIKDTTNDALKSLVQQVQDVAGSALEDWEVYPQRGASLDDFIGEPNTRRTGEAIHDRLRVALTSANVVREEDLKIRIVPVHRNKVLVVVMIDAIPTAYNQLDQGDKVSVNIVFDYLERGVFFLDKVPNLTGG